MTARLSIGVGLPHVAQTWSRIRDAALELEGLGFDSLWLDDHLYASPRPDLALLEGWTTLSALGAATSRADLGLLVSPPGFRHPALLAKMLATLSHVTNGRVVAGLGSGWYEDEFRGYGLPFPPVRERLEQLEETLVILQKMWNEPQPRFSGKHYEIDGPFCEPRPETPPKILIGGAGEKVLLRIAAKHAALWNNPAKHIGDLPRKVDVLRHHCHDVGRDPEAVTISQHAVVVLCDTDAEARRIAENAQTQYGAHRFGDFVSHGLWGSAERVVERLHSLAQVGAAHVIVEFYARNALVPARLFAERVLPAL